MRFRAGFAGLIGGAAVVLAGFGAAALPASASSTCNVCADTNPENATLLHMNADGSGREIEAKGLRNTIGFGWQPCSLTFQPSPCLPRQNYFYPEDNLQTLGHMICDVYGICGYYSDFDVALHIHTAKRATAQLLIQYAY